MIKLLLLILFTIVMTALFAAALHFSRYKKRKSGCGCGAKVSLARRTAAITRSKR